MVDRRAGLRSREQPASTTTPPPSSTPTAPISASTARTTSRIAPGFWEKFYFSPGNLGYPVFQTRVGKVGVYICYDRHFPEGARILGLNGAEIVFNPSATVAGLSRVSLEARAAGARRRQRLLRRRDQPRRHRSAVEHRRVLRPELLLRSARQLRRRRQPRQGRAGRRRPRSRHDRGSPQHLAVLSRPPARIPTAHDGGAPTRASRHGLLIKNGTIVTATRRLQGGRALRGREDLGHRHDLPSHRSRPTRRSTPPGKYVIPGGIDVHTHLDMPFGGTTSADDFETGHDRRGASAARPTIVDFAIQYRGQTLRHALDDVDEEGRGQGRHRLRLPHDRHRADRRRCSTTWTRMVRDEGVTSFKLFMAYPGVFMVDDATIFQALRRTGENGGLDLHARRERRRDRRAGQGGAAQGTDGAEVPRADPPAARRRRSHRPRHRARRNGRRADLHRPPVVAPTRSRRCARRATSACRPTPRPARSTCSSPTTTTRSPASTARST